MLKGNGISALFTSLTPTGESESSITETTISSLADTWIKLSNKELKKGRVRNLVVVKSRGMGHSNEVNDFIITDNGIKILNPYSEIKNEMINSASKKK
jgi:circadian clock protein KaiC